MTLNLRFLQSGSALSDLPKDDVPEVAIIGRSNYGKSSTLNALGGSNKLARTSKTPGRTRLINLFEGDHGRLIDLPGYGYAKMDKGTAKACSEMLFDYLTQRKNLVGVIQIMDVRHPLQPVDAELLHFLPFHIPLLVALNKADKLSKNKVAQARHVTQRDLVVLRPIDELTQIISYSAASKIGLDEIKKFIQKHCSL